MPRGVIVHYPRDGLTYMKGECGANSISSTKNLLDVTCERCKEIISNNAPAGKLEMMTNTQEECMYAKPIIEFAV